MSKGRIPKEDRATVESLEEFEVSDLDLDLDLSEDEVDQVGQGSNTESRVPTPAPTVPLAQRSQSADDATPPPAASQAKQVSRKMDCCPSHLPGGLAHVQADPETAQRGLQTLHLRLCESSHAMWLQPGQQTDKQGS